MTQNSLLKLAELLGSLSQTSDVFELNLKTPILQTLTRTADLSLHHYAPAVCHCRRRCKIRACGFPDLIFLFVCFPSQSLSNTVYPDFRSVQWHSKAENQRDTEKDEHVVPLGKSIWNYRWPEEPGLAAAPVCPRSAAEEKAELFCQVRFGREKVHLQILGMPSKKQNGK